MATLGTEDYLNNVTLQRAMKNAEASINMEGLTVPDCCKILCQKLLNQRISFEEYLKLIIAENTKGDELK